MIPHTAGEWAWAVIGAISGACGGMFIMAVLVAARTADDAMDSVRLRKIVLDRYRLEDDSHSPDNAERRK